MELSIIVMWCMTSASQWKFSAMQLALYTSRSGWLEPAEAGENRFNLVKCTWYKRESHSLAPTSALDFNKRGCVRQI